MSEKEKSNKSSRGIKPSQKIWKKWWFWALIVAVLIGGVLKFTEPETEEPETGIVEPTKEPTATKEPETEPPIGTAEPTKAEEPIAEPTDKPAETEVTEHREGMYGISDKNIDDVDAHFSVSKARNDVTGNWRISTIAESIKIEEYALSYYKKYFSDDAEVHVIVNFTYNTSTTITYLGSMLDVSIHEYVDKEEHDAKKMCSGMLLREYYIYLDNGDIEEIQ